MTLTSPKVSAFLYVMCCLVLANVFPSYAKVEMKLLTILPILCSPSPPTILDITSTLPKVAAILYIMHCSVLGNVFPSHAKVKMKLLTILSIFLRSTGCNLNPLKILDMTLTLPKVGHSVHDALLVRLPITRQGRDKVPHHPVHLLVALTILDMTLTLPKVSAFLYIMYCLVLANVFPSYAKVEMKFLTILPIFLCSPNPPTILDITSTLPKVSAFLYIMYCPVPGNVFPSHSKAEIKFLAALSVFLRSTGCSLNPLTILDVTLTLLKVLAFLYIMHCLMLVNFFPSHAEVGMYRWLSTRSPSNPRHDLDVAEGLGLSVHHVLPGAQERLPITRQGRDKVPHHPVNLLAVHRMQPEPADNQLAQQNPSASRSNELHDIFSEALLAHGAPFAAEARPVVAGMILDSHYNAKEKATLAHAALRAHDPKGLSLGMFGSHLTYSWPRFMEEVTDCLLDIRPPGDRTAYCVGNQTKGISPVTAGTLNDCKWDIRDLLRFRNIDHFRQPSDYDIQDVPPQVELWDDLDMTLTLPKVSAFLYMMHCLVLVNVFPSHAEVGMYRWLSTRGPRSQRGLNEVPHHPVHLLVLRRCSPDPLTASGHDLDVAKGLGFPVHHVLLERLPIARKGQESPLAQHPRSQVATGLNEVPHHPVHLLVLRRCSPKPLTTSGHDLDVAKGLGLSVHDALLVRLPIARKGRDIPLARRPQSQVIGSDKVPHYPAHLLVQPEPADNPGHYLDVVKALGLPVIRQGRDVPLAQHRSHSLSPLIILDIISTSSKLLAFPSYAKVEMKFLTILPIFLCSLSLLIILDITSTSPKLLAFLYIMCFSVLANNIFPSHAKVEMKFLTILPIFLCSAGCSNPGHDLDIAKALGLLVRHVLLGARERLPIIRQGCTTGSAPAVLGHRSDKVPHCPAHLLVQPEPADNPGHHLDAAKALGVPVHHVLLGAREQHLPITRQGRDVPPAQHPAVVPSPPEDVVVGHSDRSDDRSIRRAR
ncbi:hypothetical protein QQS21_010773 [Conoideocrella luteorostrata]|uniref:Uncharacterized protein n=1 Tax=Conoideocrella luteorostrata TaxID=1105319 RepID=A0AAJ0FUC0_9HYPO|nr:hypothetical protein QQS21_010773 [Conoideocrella luteorostrata]